MSNTANARPGGEPAAVMLFPQPALQLVYDTAPIGLACLSPDCRYLQINQRLTEICGLSVEYHLGRSVRDCVPALADSVEQIVRSIMETGEPVIGVEVAGQRADRVDERFWVTYWHPLRAPSGQIVAINVAAEEITERKRSEQALRQARDAAEAALQDLREAQASLVEAEKLAALGRMVAGVAHEVNNPVGISLTVASSLQRRTERFAAEAARGGLRRSTLTEFVAAINDASNQLVTNLNRAAELVSAFKQVAADDDQSERREFDVGELTGRILLNLRPEFQERGITLNGWCEPNLRMNSYPGPYGQVLTNLAFNVIAHAFPDDRRGAVDLTVRGAGPDHIEVVFADNGSGMSAETRRRAFDPFFTTRRHEGATGLGLHIVHNIVTERLGGRIRLDSEPGSGTRVQLLLPRIVGEQSAHRSAD
ncbi:PAS domain-containing sensor histidine kinase [Bradyrhizobium sp. 31Argb]|uniref:sensor histidine kinase n=1 Tax=unclassified Bradyrhizobium TaxID=2631580 RepID=UPI001FE05A3D|nr:PAS domain-containing sensor histidine kinase [Bradyrhizobium sp. Leo170]